MVKKYRKKPVEIEAIHFNNNDLSTINEVIKFLSEGKFNSYDEYKEDQDSVKEFRVSLFKGSDYEGWYIFINTLEGEMQVILSDFIIKGIKGEFYPCKEDIFEKTYESVY